MSFDITRTVRPSQAETLIEHCMAVGRPVMLWGPPGVGKSDIVAGIAKKQGRPVVDVRLLLLDPTDLKGLPYYCPDTKTMKWAQPADMPSNTNGLDNAVLFLDELVSAPPSVQAAAYQLILNRRVGEYVLPDNVSIVCAGNRESDRGVTYKMPSPLANRLIHLEMASHFDDWQSWAIQNQVHPDVVGFLSYHKQKLFAFDPKSPEKAFATPRSWAFVSDFLSSDIGDEGLVTTLVAGTVGDGMATEFMAHRRISSQLPSAESILNGSVTTLATKEISAIYSLTVSLSYALKEALDKYRDPVNTKEVADEWHRMVNFYFKFLMDNCQPEMVIFGITMAWKEYAMPIRGKKVAVWDVFCERYGKYLQQG